MSLRKSPTPTPDGVAGNCRNAELSTGPSTPAGKENSKRHSRKHGLDAREGKDFRASLAALGEDPEEFDRLYQDLLRAYQPADPLWARQVEDLARLYWRRARLDRIKNALLLRQRATDERERERRAMEEDRDTHETLDAGVGMSGVWQLPDSVAKFRIVISNLEMIQALVEMRQYDEAGKVRLRYLYGHYKPWRGANIARAYESLSSPQEGKDDVGEFTRQNLQKDLEAELAAARKQYAWCKAQHAEPAPAARDACLAPEGKAWPLILREERDLDRAIDRKVRILLDLRRNHHFHELVSNAEPVNPAELEAGSGQEEAPPEAT